MTIAQTNTLRALLDGVMIFRHGCTTADNEAAAVAWECKCHIVGHPGPDSVPPHICHTVRPVETHFKRNRTIVDLSDTIVAIPWQDARPAEPIGGVWYTVNYATKRNKKVYIIWPDGRIECSESTAK